MNLSCVAVGQPRLCEAREYKPSRSRRSPSLTGRTEREIGCDRLKWSSTMLQTICSIFCCLKPSVLQRGNSRLGKIATLVAAGLSLAGCAWIADTKYGRNPYDGNWTLIIESEKCGSEERTFTSRTGRFQFLVLENKIFFQIIPINGVAASEYQGKAEFRSGTTNEIVAIAERPEYRIQFERYSYGFGEWSSEECAGTIQLVQIKSF